LYFIFFFNLSKLYLCFCADLPSSSNFQNPSLTYREEIIKEKAGVIIGLNRRRYDSGCLHVSRHGRRGIIFLIPLCAADFPGIFIVHNWNKCKRATRKSERENSQ